MRLRVSQRRGAEDEIRACRSGKPVMAPTLVAQAYVEGLATEVRMLLHLLMGRQELAADRRVRCVRQGICQHAGTDPDIAQG